MEYIKPGKTEQGTDEWKFLLMENGVPYVMWGLINMMLMSYASNLDFQVDSH